MTGERTYLETVPEQYTRATSACHRGNYGSARHSKPVVSPQMGNQGGQNRLKALGYSNSNSAFSHKSTIGSGVFRARNQVLRLIA
jgi:hypothetical protein